MTATERILADLLADLLRIERVPADAHFFDDLGADSMRMAHFCARVRKRVDLPSVSIKDVYRHPTIGELAAALAPSRPRPRGRRRRRRPIDDRRRARRRIRPLRRAAAPRRSSATSLAARSSPRGSSGSPPAPGCSTSTCALGRSRRRRPSSASRAFPIVAKWVLVGRWKRRQIPLWSLAYLRFWVVKTLIRTSPLVLFAGSPLYVLVPAGARRRDRPGRRGPLPHRAGLHRPAHDRRRHGRPQGLVPHLLPRAGRRDRDRPGHASAGTSFVGEKTVLDIGTSIGDGAQLGHSSSLHAGQAVPAGERWHGSPGRARPTSTTARSTAAAASAAPVVYAAAPAAEPLLVAVPLPLGRPAVLVLAAGPAARRAAPTRTAVHQPGVLRRGAARVGRAVLRLPLAGLLVADDRAPAAQPAVQPDRIYPLHGCTTRPPGDHPHDQQQLFTALFGDSSFIVRYLRWPRLRLVAGRADRVELRHRRSSTRRRSWPRSARGTMVADGLSIINADYSSTVVPGVRRRRSAAQLPRQPHRLPGAGPDRRRLPARDEGHGPGRRSGAGGRRPARLARLRDPAHRSTATPASTTCARHELRRRLRRKNRHNARHHRAVPARRAGCTSSASPLLAAAGAATCHGARRAPAFARRGLVATLRHRVLRAGRAGHRRRSGRYSPDCCSIYDPFFWRHERFWKVPPTPTSVFDGTPFKTVLWRLLGVRIGRRVFDDGCYLTERPLTAIGDHCTLNAGTMIQCHSQEDGAFKSDRIAIGAGCTLGVGAFVHYGVDDGRRRGARARTRS